MARQLAAAVLALLALRLVVADLPIHCLNVQVAGKWVFEMSKATGTKNLRCGHKVPDTNMDHFTKHGYDLEVVRTYELELQEPNIVVDSKGNRGTWTMVYDEGFEVVIKNRRFFAFNKYVPKTPASLSKDAVEDYISICNETLVGWFHKENGRNWGCYHGKKISRDSNIAIEKGGSTGKELTKVLAPSAMALQPSGSPRFSSRFNDDDMTRIENDPVWEPDYSFVEMVNNDKTRTWRAGVHRHFVGNRVSQMMRLLGGRVVTEKPHHKKYKKHGHIGSMQDDRPDAAKYHGLPESFDWRSKDGNDYDSPVKNQGNCGSCYAMAAISVAESRIRIATHNKDKPLLSSQHVVSCSIYNQGCDGGYPYLVGKHAMDHGLYEESCMGYSASNSKCHTCSGRKWVATNYSYIGGYYGGCSEVAMMKEIFEKGPIMVAFDAPSDLFYYNGGVYTGAKPPHEGPKLPGLNWWEKTNHAVVGMGWGVDEKGVKYWIIKNTWGASWGEKGYFRIRRGTDECGIESMASWMDIKPA